MTRADWERRYLAGETFRQIAATDGVNEATVRRAVKTRRPRGPRMAAPTSAEAIRATLKTGDMPSAAAALGVSKTTIAHRLWLVGLVRDPISTRAKTRQTRKNVPWLDWPPMAAGGLRERIAERDARFREQVAAGRSVAEIAEETGIEARVIRAAVKDMKDTK